MAKEGKDKDSIRLLVFLPSLGGGGAERHVLRLVNGLVVRGIKVRIAVTKKGAYDHLLSDKVKLINLLEKHTASSTIRMIKSIRPLRDFLDKWNPDILLSVLNHANITAFLSLEKSKHRKTIKHICCVQNNLSNELVNLPLLLRIAYSWLLPKTFRQSSRVIAISDGVLEDICFRISGCRSKVTRIYNIGFDPEIQSMSMQPVPEMRRCTNLLVACGRLETQKNYPLLIRAMKRILEALPDTELWILGEGKLRTKIEAMIARFDLGDSIRLLGFRTNPYPFIRMADIFVLSSDWEGFGNVLVEAMACGTPPVSTDCPYGPSEIITDGMNGFLVDKGDVAALADAIIRLLHDKEMLHTFSRNAQQTIHMFSEETICNQYTDAMKEVRGNHVHDVI